MSRTSMVTRETRETRIRVKLDLDGRGRFRIETGVPFVNHMLEALARHSLFDLDVAARGDLEVDYHHMVEDVGLVLGEALRKALGDKKGLRRFGSAVVPMDDALARVAVDLGGRPWLAYRFPLRQRKIRDFDTRLFREMFQAFANEARLNLHVELLGGEDLHHAVEAVFKALARALLEATRIDPRAGLPSTKGTLS